MSNGALRCFWLLFPIKRQEKQRRQFSLFSEEEEGESGMGGSLRASRASQGPAPVFPAPRSERLCVVPPSAAGKRAERCGSSQGAWRHRAGGRPCPCHSLGTIERTRQPTGSRSPTICKCPLLPSGRMMSITGRLWIITSPSDVTNTRDALHQNNNGGLTATFKADILVFIKQGLSFLNVAILFQSIFCRMWTRRLRGKIHQ